MYNITEIQSTVKDFVTAFPITKVILVGSYAKNQATEKNDIDLVIDGEVLSNSHWVFLFKEDAFSTKIDLIAIRGLKNSCLHDNILSGGIVLYEA